MFIFNPVFWIIFFPLCVFILLTYDKPVRHKSEENQNHLPIKKGVALFLNRTRESFSKKKTWMLLSNILLYICFLGIFADIQSLYLVRSGGEYHLREVLAHAGEIAVILIGWLSIGYASLRATFGSKIANLVLLGLLLNILSLVFMTFMTGLLT